MSDCSLNAKENWIDHKTKTIFYFDSNRNRKNHSTQNNFIVYNNVPSGVKFLSRVFFCAATSSLGNNLLTRIVRPSKLI